MLCLCIDYLKGFSLLRVSGTLESISAVDPVQTQRQNHQWCLYVEAEEVDVKSCSLCIYRLIPCSLLIYRNESIHTVQAQVLPERHCSMSSAVIVPHVNTGSLCDKCCRDQTPPSPFLLAPTRTFVSQGLEAQTDLCGAVPPPGPHTVQSLCGGHVEHPCLPPQTARFFTPTHPRQNSPHCLAW